MLLPRTGAAAALADCDPVETKESQNTNYEPNDWEEGDGKSCARVTAEVGRAVQLKRNQVAVWTICLI
ncbi:MAG TPA: hypothetical protein VE242_05720 [Chthoniobacterales bacterium]|nr:hypothetical protein [Chthoniobacterales bacterium]